MLASEIRELSEGDIQARIMLRTDRDGGETKRIETTVGRVLFNLALPPEIGKFYNTTLDKKQLRKVVADCYRLFPDPYDTAAVVNETYAAGQTWSPNTARFVLMLSKTL